MPKSPEGGDLPPKNKDENESPEAEWSRWKEVIENKPQDTVYALRAGRRLGVPDDEIKAIAQAAFDKHSEAGWNALAYQIMKEAELGTSEERFAMGEKVYEENIKRGNPAGALSIAKELWGEKSTQSIFTQRLIETKEEELEKKIEKEQKRAEPLMRLSPDATFKDFDAVWYTMVSEVGSGINVEIEADMNHVFGEQLTKQVMDFLNGRDTTLVNEKVLDFFKEHGFTKAQLGEVMGIVFRKPRTTKGE